jgi:hypothetical protein
LNPHAINFDDLTKSLASRHTGESRYPEPAESTGFRVKHGMTKQGKIDLLRGCQLYFPAQWGTDLKSAPSHPNRFPVSGAVYIRTLFRLEENGDLCRGLKERMG